MNGFEVSLNGAHVATAALDGVGALLALVTWHRADATDGPDPDLRVHLSGATATESLEWVDQELTVGDVVTIRVAHVDHPTAAAVSPRTPETAEEYTAKLRARAEKILRELDE